MASPAGLRGELASVSRTRASFPSSFPVFCLESNLADNAASHTPNSGNRDGGKYFDLRNLHLSDFAFSLRLSSRLIRVNHAAGIRLIWNSERGGGRRKNRPRFDDTLYIPLIFISRCICLFGTTFLASFEYIWIRKPRGYKCQLPLLPDSYQRSRRIGFKRKLY